LHISSPVPLKVGGVMMDLNDKIARLEIRVEQVLIHLRMLVRGSAEAEPVRSELFKMLTLLRRYKQRREHLEELLGLEIAA
jgi:hypothetical protein